MNLHRMLRERAAEGRPLRVGLIGAGKFGSMYLSQARRTPGVHLVGVADLSPPRAKAALKRVGWPAAALVARSLADAARNGTTRVLDDAQALIAAPEVEIVELGISVASVGLRREPTGAPQAWHGDVVATAKRDLKSGETLDGEGGFTVYGRLMPAHESLAIGGLPIGLAHRVRLKRQVPAGAPVCWSDVAIDARDPAAAFRREMERTFGEPMPGKRVSGRRVSGERTAG